MSEDTKNNFIKSRLASDFTVREFIRMSSEVESIRDPEFSTKHSILRDSSLKYSHLNKEVDFSPPPLSDNALKKEIIFPNFGEFSEGEEFEEDPCQQDQFQQQQDETKELSEGDSTFSSDTISSVYSKLSPYIIQWSFGIKTSVELINLTRVGCPEVFYVSSHFGIIYNYRLHKMRFLPGHNYPIKSIAADANGRWLVTADAGKDTAIIIWDNKKQLPAWCLYNVFPGGVKYVKISPDARFLAAVNCNFNYVLKFWLWTYGPENPDGFLEIDSSFGEVTHINFNHLTTEQFIITLKNRVIFCRWEEKMKIIKNFTPEFEYIKKWGKFRESLFLDNNHTVLTSTSTGYVMVWSDNEITELPSENPIKAIEKKFIKGVKIHKSGITSLKLCDNIVATSSEDGNIFFHDQLLRLIYILPKVKISPIVSISFNLKGNELNSFAAHLNEKKKLLREQGQEQHFSDDEISKINSTQNESYNSMEKDLEMNPNESETTTRKQSTILEYKTKKIPSDCTIEAKPFHIRDLIFLTTTGRIGYLSHYNKRIRYFFSEAGAPVTCIACSPNKSHLLISYATGRLTLFDYIEKKMLVTVVFPGMVLTSLKYSHWGHMLMAGTANGSVLELDPILLVLKTKLTECRSSIQKICFSKNDNFLAFYEQHSVVHIFGLKQWDGSKKWVFMGNYNSHFKPIVGILFETNPQYSKNPRLFTLGEDRMLVEYDTSNVEVNRLKLLNVDRIEQTAIPCCFAWYPQFFENLNFLISNSEFKLKVVDINTHVCQKTTLGPTADTPIKFMKVLPRSDSQRISAKMIYATEKHIGIKMLPATGNPFEGMGMTAHPEKMTSLAISYDYKYIFTAGINDASVLMWEVNLSSVDVAFQMGGLGLEPFVSLIQGGVNSFLFKEIEDFFYYAQIIHQGEDPNQDRSVTKSLALCEVPDLFRALGYYLTDYEIKNLLYELQHINYDETGKIEDEVTFEECIKAFLNHKPVEGMSINYINKALMTIADLSDPTDVVVEANSLYKALEENGENMSHKEIVGYLCILLLPKDENNPIPPSLPLNYFVENVLGIDLTISEENVRQITHNFENKNQ